MRSRDPDIYIVSDGRCRSQSPTDKAASGQAWIAAWVSLNELNELQEKSKRSE